MLDVRINSTLVLDSGCGDDENSDDDGPCEQTTTRRRTSRLSQPTVGLLASRPADKQLASQLDGQADGRIDDRTMDKYAHGRTDGRMVRSIGRRPRWSCRIGGAGTVSAMTMGSYIRRTVD